MKTDMNVEKLIAEVSKRNSLWNQAHSDHHNRYVLEKKWGEVANILHVTTGQAKYKWKYLRDSFRRELKKSLTPRSGDTGITLQDSQWTYYKSLSFLKDQFESLYMNVSELDQSEVDGSETWQDANGCNSEIKFDVREPNEEFSAIATPKSPITFTQDSASSNEGRDVDANRNKKRKVLHMQSNNEQKLCNDQLDEDRCFFESIIPHVRNLSPKKKMQFRTKVQELVMLYAYDDET